MEWSKSTGARVELYFIGNKRNSFSLFQSHSSEMPKNFFAEVLLIPIKVKISVPSINRESILSKNTDNGYSNIFPWPHIF